MYMYSIRIIFTDKSGAYVDSAYPAIYSQRAGDVAWYSHDCLARINDLATFDIPTPPQLNSVYTLHGVVYKLLIFLHTVFMLINRRSN